MGLSKLQWQIGKSSVERTLFKFCKTIPRLSTESLPCSNIVDPTDADIQNLFTPEQWAEITSTIPDLHESDLQIIDGLDQVQTLEDLSQVIQNTPHSSPTATPEQTWQVSICMKLYIPPPLPVGVHICKCITEVNMA